MARKVLIVGGGHNGLVCACYLRRAGHAVTVLERRHIVGGAAVTEEFHPGFRNSVASYTVSLLHPKIIKDLRLHEHGLRILPRRINNFVPLPDNDSLVSSANTEDMLSEVSRFSKKDASALTQYYAQLDRIVPVVKEIMLMTPPSVIDSGVSDLIAAFKLTRAFSGLTDTDKRFLLRLFAVSAGELLDDIFETDAIKALLGFDAIVGHFASPYSPGSAYVLLHHVLGEVNGKSGVWGHAVGGMGAITQAMAAEAKHLGVELRVNAGVSEVLVKRGKAVGVQLEDGNQLFSDIVVAGVNPKLLYNKLIDPSHVPIETLKHFQNYKCQSGTFRMNVALHSLPNFTARMPDRCLEGGIIMAPSLDYMDKAYIDARELGWSANPIVEMLIPSLVDDSLAPSGQHVASLFCQHFDPALAGEWETKREDAVRDIFKTINNHAPNFSESVIGMEAHSPLDLETKFGLVGGDIFHGRLSLDQLFSARPMLGMGQYAADINSLYLCGSGTHPGGGVSGIPGHNSAREILRRL